MVTRKDEKGRQRRHDVVMDLKHRTGYQQLAECERPPLASLIEEAGQTWLQARAEKNGFSFANTEICVEGYHQHRAAKRGRENTIRYSTLDFTGLLTVENEELFRAVLMSGIGSAKAFGCGLMLVRRV